MVMGELTIEIKQIPFLLLVYIFNYFAAYVCNIGSIWYFINYIDSILLIVRKHSFEFDPLLAGLPGMQLTSCIGA